VKIRLLKANFLIRREMMRKLNQFVKQVENAENIILYNFYNGKSIKYSKVNFQGAK